MKLGWPLLQVSSGLILFLSGSGWGSDLCARFPQDELRAVGARPSLAQSGVDQRSTDTTLNPFAEWTEARLAYRSALDAYASRFSPPLRTAHDDPEENATPIADFDERLEARFRTTPHGRGLARALEAQRQAVERLSPDQALVLEALAKEPNQPAFDQFVTYAPGGSGRLTVWFKGNKVRAWTSSLSSGLSSSGSPQAAVLSPDCKVKILSLFDLATFRENPPARRTLNGALCRKLPELQKLAVTAEMETRTLTFASLCASRDGRVLEVPGRTSKCVCPNGRTVPLFFGIYSQRCSATALLTARDHLEKTLFDTSQWAGRHSSDLALLIDPTSVVHQKCSQLAGHWDSKPAIPPAVFILTAPPAAVLADSPPPDGSVSAR